MEEPGVSDLVFNTIQQAEMDIRPQLYNSIVLSGGSTMYPGLPTRLETDIRNRYLNEIVKGSSSCPFNTQSFRDGCHRFTGDKARAQKLKLKVEDPPRRKHMVFLGASVFGEIAAGS